MGSRWGWHAAAGVLLAASAVMAPAAEAAGAPLPPRLRAPNAHGLTLRSGPEPVDVNGDGAVRGAEERMLDVTVTSRAIYRGGHPQIDPARIPVRVRIYLPDGYRPAGRPYPVLYLLHGGDGDADDWSQPAEGDVMDLVDGQDAFEGIVVMPEGGDAGNYTDWAANTDGGFRPHWETFHTRQLVRWIDANFNTVARRSGRAIAGLSMGGFGALHYAGRHPGLFSAVGAFSPPADIGYAPLQDIAAVTMGLWGASVGAGDGDDGYDFSGAPYLVNGPPGASPEAQRAYRLRAVWGPERDRPRHDPVRLAGAGAYDRYGSRLYLYTGEGDPQVDPLEWHVRRMADSFHDALTARGVDHGYCRGPGNHVWPFWREDLRHFLQATYGTAPASCPNGWTEVP